MKALLLASLFIAITVQIASSYKDYGHPEDHSHPSNATFLYHDYYARTNEGDTVELCARLNQPLDEELTVHYTTESANETAEKQLDYLSVEGILVFEPGIQEKCIRIDTFDDNHAGEEDLETFFVYWQITDTDDVYFYDSYYDDRAYTTVNIKDDDVLTLRPDKNNVTVYEGDYAEICVSPDMLERDSPTLFYVLYDDKHYTANLYHDLEYTHYEEYDDFDHYGGIKRIYPNESEACFHFHTYDDDKFEGNEQFAIKLFSFSPLNYTEIQNIGNTSFAHGNNPIRDAFYHGDFDHAYGHHDDGGHHGNNSHHDNDDCDCNDYDYYEDFKDYYAYYYSELYTHNTHIPYSVSTIRVTIVDNDPAPCLSEDGEACKQVIKDTLCLLLQKKGNKNIKDLPRPCRKPGGKLLGKFLRYDPHPNQNDNN